MGNTKLKIFLIGLLLIYSIFGLCCKKDTCSTCPLQGNDTTSHNFSFETFVLGDSTGTSSLYDVAIIGDTVWAVGEIWQGGTQYNAAKGDGQTWELKRIQSTICGSNNYIVSALRTVFAFSGDDIWYSDGGEMIHWNGQNYNNDCSMNSILTGAINKLWGYSSDNLYAVGNNGAIIHYSSGTWTKIEGGTTTTINDVFGVLNKRTNQYEIYCAVTDFFQPKDRKILRITNTSVVDSISWNTGKDVVSVWSADGIFLYVAGNGFFENSTGIWKEIKFGVYTNRVRGSAANNLFVVGDLGLIANFNGSTWKTFYPDVNSDYSSVAVTNNLTIAVGSKGAQAFAVIGKR